MTTGKGSFSDERDAALRLSLADGLGPRRIQLLVDDRGSALAALHAPSFGVEAAKRMKPGFRKALTAVRGLDTGTYWDRAWSVGAGAVSRNDPEYPVLLKPIYAPPPVLWVRRWPAGLDFLGDGLAVAVVGTRRATPYGRRIARAIGADLASRGVVVVSGLAYGIDREAHEGAIEAGGATIAVMGCGIDRIYPRPHARLAGRIMERGAIVSEFAPGTPPAPGQFPRRNRVIAGISRATVLVESHSRGGALITTRLAGDLGRSIFCVPGPVDSPASRGVHEYFLEGGAHLVTRVEDIAEGLGLDARSAVPALPDLTEREKAVLRAVTADPLPLESITDATGLEVSAVLSSLLTLELKGLLRQLAGRHFCLVGVGAA